MGVRIKIGTSERDINNIESNWINEQIKRRRDEGTSVCVRVFIEHGGIDIVLSTADCPQGPGRNRRLTKSENEVVALWKKLHLNEDNYSSGNLIAFLKQLRI
jgi:hypothetical protein